MMRARLVLALLATLSLGFVAPSKASALTMTPTGVTLATDLLQGEHFSVTLASADPGSGGELIFRFSECCSGVSVGIQMMFDAPVVGVTNYKPAGFGDGFIQSLTFSGSTVNLGGALNLGSMFTWGVEFATYPTSATIVGGLGIGGTVAFVPEPGTGVLVFSGLAFLFAAGRRQL